MISVTNSFSYKYLYGFMSPLVQIDKSFRKQSEMEILATFLSNTRENNFQSNSNGKILFLMIKSKTGFWLNDEFKEDSLIKWRITERLNAVEIRLENIFIRISNSSTGRHRSRRSIQTRRSIGSSMSLLFHGHSIDSFMCLHRCQYLSV